MSKIIAITGATGAQGGSVVSALSSNPSYKLRAITRNTSSDKAQALSQRGIETVAADYDDEESLVRAFEGASVVWAVTDFLTPFSQTGDANKTIEVEYQHGRNLARAAARTSSLETYLWSTLPDAHELSKGEILIPHFDGKAKVDRFIKSDPALLAKTVFVYVGFYASNLFYPPYSPFYAKPIEKYLAFTPTSVSTKISALGPVSNVGVAVKALLEKPYPKSPIKPDGGRYLYITTGDITTKDYYARWSQGSGKGPVQVVHVPFETYEALYGIWGNEMGLMMKFWESVGAEKSWKPVGEGDVLVDSRELPGVSDGLVSVDTAFKETNWDSLF